MLAGADSVTAVDVQVQSIGPVAKVVEGVVQQIADMRLGQSQGFVEPVAAFDFAQQVVVPVVQQVVY